ncbi:MAG: Rne/Rng family ribonuclease [Acidobacteriota bacterium]
MVHKMLVESDPHQTRIAVLEDDRLTEIFVERKRHLGLVGNVYKGRVTRVLPGMQAAFVDMGLERDAFLYVSDVVDNVEAVEDLDLARQAVSDLSSTEQASIDELLRAGQEIIVQVVKDPLPNKGARVSTHVTLPGRYLVLLPTVRHFGVSRRIEGEDERTRLLELLEGLPPASGGLIVRTVGEGKGGEEFEADIEYLNGLWSRVRERATKVSAPTLLHRDHDLALRVVRDVVSRDFSVLWVDGEETYERIVEFLDEVQPALVSRVKLYRQDESLFDRFDIESQIEAALKSKVWLKSGGYIVINPTEALVAIDVNTGRFVGQRNLEDTVLKTNLEAVKEIVRQIRLRDLGGILVIDLIDMIEQEHRDQVFALLEEELHKDRAKTKVLSISEFGLVEITRKRSRSNLERLLTQPCPHCSGSGRIQSLATICLKIRGEILRTIGAGTGSELLLRVHPEVAGALQGEERAILSEIERTVGGQILLQSDPELHQENFNLTEV